MQVTVRRYGPYNSGLGGLFVLQIEQVVLDWEKTIVEFYEDFYLQKRCKKLESKQS